MQGRGAGDSGTQRGIRNANRDDPHGILRVLMRIDLD
jgi:hypothetical protein